MQLPLRINRNKMGYLTFIQISSLMILGGIFWAATAKSVASIVFLVLSILLTIFFLKKSSMASKEYIELTEKEITIHFSNGTTRFIPVNDVYEVMHCRNRITADNKVNRNYFVVELRDKKREKIVQINKSSFNSEELIRLVTYLIEVREARLVNE